MKPPFLRSSCFTEADENINEMGLFYKANQIQKLEETGNTTRCILFFLCYSCNIFLLINVFTIE